MEATEEKTAEEAPKKKRQTKSWKTEAQQFEAWLVEVLEGIHKASASEEGFHLGNVPPAIHRWFAERKQAAEANAEATRERALGKLTAEERAALGL